MAATRLITLHTRAGAPCPASSIESALRRSTDYIKNGEKTNGGELVLSYQCDPLTAPQELALAKRQYAIKTGRSQGDRDVIAYHLRQAFKPGEIDAGGSRASSVRNRDVAYERTTRFRQRHSRR